MHLVPSNCRALLDLKTMLEILIRQIFIPGFSLYSREIRRVLDAFFRAILEVLVALTIAWTCVSRVRIHIHHYFFLFFFFQVSFSPEKISDYDLKIVLLAHVA